MRRELYREKLFGSRENVSQISAGPADRTWFDGKLDCTAFNTPAEPVEKLFFLFFYHHRVTSDAKRMNQRMMCFQFFGKPVGPFRYSRNPVDVGDGSPNESPVRTCQQSPSRTGAHVAQ